MIESSFVTDVQDAVFDRLSDGMGPDGAYAQPAYLQIASARQSAGQPVPLLPEDKQPAIWMEFIASVQAEGSIGFAHIMEDTYSLFGTLVFTPDNVGYRGNDDQAFAKIALASADTFRLRMVNLLKGWSPGVMDTVTGWKATLVTVDLSSIVPNRIGDFKIAYTAILRCRIQIEP